MGTAHCAHVGVILCRLRTKNWRSPLRTRGAFWEGDVPYDFFKLGGWPVVVVENETFDMKVEDPNDFQKLRLQHV